MKVHMLSLGPLGANCYILETDQKNAIAVDIGGDPEILLRLLRQQGLHLDRILLTHGHYDHLGGVAQVQQETGAPVYIHGDDLGMLTDEIRSLSTPMGMQGFAPVPDADTLTDGEHIRLDDVDLTVLHTPGHTPGSVCYLGNGLLLSGDTLFRQSIGRTDFPGGSMPQMRKSLTRLNGLTGDLLIYPGHNGASTLDYEKEHNPYLRDYT